MLLKKCLREIKINKSQFINIFIMVFLGVFVFTGIHAYMDGMEKSANDYYEKNNLQDLWVSGENFTKQDLEDYYVFNSIIVDVDDIEKINQTTVDIENTIKSAIAVTNRDSSPSVEVYNSEVEDGDTYSGVFTFLFLFIALLSVVTTMNRFVKKQRTQIGTLKALGFKTSKITLHYISYGFVISLISSALGVIAGKYILGRPFIEMEMTYFEIPKVKNTNFDITTKGILKKASIYTKWNIRDVFRNKGRSIMAVVGVTGCTMLLVCAFGDNNWYTSKIVGLNRDPQNQQINATRNYYESLGLNYKPDAVYTNKDLSEVNEISGVDKIQSVGNIRSGMESMLGVMKTMVVLLIVVSAVLSFVIIYNLGTLSFSEKQYQFATLKVLGFSMISYIFGSALGEDYDFNAEVSIVSYLFAIVGSYVVAILVNKWLSRKVKSIDMVSSLKANE